MSQLDTEFPVGAARSERVFKAPRQFTRLRELSRIHMTLVGDVVRAQARIQGPYRSRGVLVTGVDVYSTCRPRRVAEAALLQRADEGDKVL